MRAKEAPDHIKANWPGVSWIIEMITTTVTRRGHQVPRAHYFLTSLRTKPEALLRLIRQRWSYCFAEAWRLRERVALAAGYAAARRRSPLRQPQRSASVFVPAHGGDEPAARRRLPISARRPARAEPRHQGNARSWRRGHEHDMKLLLGGPAALANLAAVAPRARIFELSARTGEGVDALLHWFSHQRLGAPV